MTIGAPSPGSPTTSAAVRWGAWVATLFLAVGLVTHLPGLIQDLFNSDEASLATMGMVIDRGGELYHETGDRKPPIVPYLYAAVFGATGDQGLEPVRLLGVLFLAATALLLAFEARRRGGSNRAGLVCGLLFLAGSVAIFPADSQAAGFETFMLLPMTAAIVAAARGHGVLAGVCLALACLCKQTAVTTALPVAYLLLKRDGWPAVARCAMAAAAIVVVVAVQFGLRDFLLWTVTGNGGYLALRGSLLGTAVRGIGMTGAFLVFNGVVVWCCVVAHRRGAVTVDLWLWLAGAGVAVLAGFRFFGHYYLQLLPPLALMAAAGLPSTGRAWRWAAAGVLVPVLAMWGFAFFPPADRGIPAYAAVASRIDALTSPDERIFVWGQYPELYWAANREPATRFIHTGFLTGNSGGRDPAIGQPTDGLPGAWDLLAADMASHPPALIVDTSAAAIRGSQHYALDRTPLWDAVQRDYELVETVDGVRFYRLVGATSPG
ncbi:MAG: hypothetical protein QOD63_1077 [Actinomycetota bacterium]|nr:hypothetical protein [Actinomycetota bacterium]